LEGKKVPKEMGTGTKKTKNPKKMGFGTVRDVESAPKKNGASAHLKNGHCAGSDTQRKGSKNGTIILDPKKWEPKFLGPKKKGILHPVPLPILAPKNFKWKKPAGNDPQKNGSWHHFNENWHHFQSVEKWCQRLFKWFQDPFFRGQKPTGFST